MQESYGIAYVPTCGRFAGVQIAMMQHYGFPRLYAIRKSAQLYICKWIADVNERRKLQASVEAGPYCMTLSRSVIEVYSGRLEVSNGEFYLLDPRKKTYKQLFDKLKLGREEEIKHAERGREIRLEIKRSKKRILYGTALDFSQE